MRLACLCDTPVSVVTVVSSPILAEIASRSGIVYARLFHEIFHDGTTSDAQHYELKLKRTLFKVENMIFCHNNYDGNQIRYVVQEKMQLSSCIVVEAATSPFHPHPADHQEGAGQRAEK